MSFTNLGMVYFYIYWWITRLVVALKNGTSSLHQLILPFDDLTGVYIRSLRDLCVTCPSVVVLNLTSSLEGAPSPRWDEWFLPGLLLMGSTYM